MKTDVIVIGAGAAGLMCAALAAQRGRSVLVIDHANKAGKKILMSGGGRCNFTNYYVEPSRYLSANPHFCKSALTRYTQWDFIALVEKHGIPYHEKQDGELFCDNKSSDILNMLLRECEESGVIIRLKTPVNHVRSSEAGGYQLSAGGEDLECESLVIATGGLSIPTLGATDFGYSLAEQFSIPVLPRRAGLVPFTITDQLKRLCTELSGSSLKVCITAESGKGFTGNMLFTHRGLSGPAVLQISSYWNPGEALEIDLIPDADLAVMLRDDQHKKPKTTLKNYLSQWLTQRMAEHLTDLLAENKPLGSLTGSEMDHIADTFHRWRVTPSGTEGYRTAEVTLGGVDTDAVSSKTMEAKAFPGLYFIGEVLDVTGHLGGFNFQWAWSSASAAAEYV